MPEDVIWHFIGHLQSNKAKALITGVPNLQVLETLDTTKLADKLQVNKRFAIESISSVKYYEHVVCALHYYRACNWEGEK